MRTQGIAMKELNAQLILNPEKTMVDDEYVQ